MSQIMEDLLANQKQIMVAMNQLLSNFKKDSQERKTPDYIRRRLETLDSYWQEFQSNHAQLSGFSNKSIDYFALNHYQQTKDFYLSTRETIKQAGTMSVLRPATPLAGTSRAGVEENPRGNHPEDVEATTFLETPDYRSKGTNSKLDELLKKQTINFKAFSRAVANINIDVISEKWEFQDTLKTLETRWSVIDTLHWELEGELDGKNESYEEKFSSFEMTYNNMKRSLNSKLWSVSHREKSTPKMEVPVFNGNYHQWVSFKDLFTEAIHHNPSLSQAQKMQFLKAKVKGEAEGLIQHLQISSENYSACWEVLNHRFNNKNLIFTSHLNILMNLPVMHQPSLHNVKRIHDTTLECLNAIKNLGVDVSTWDPLLVYLMSNKLDAETHSDYIESLKKPRELAVLSDFLDFLEAKFTSMETTRRKQDHSHQKPSHSNAKSFKETNYFNKHNRSFNVKQSYSSNKDISKSSNSKFLHYKRTCPLCKNGHGLFHCEQYWEMSPINKKLFVNKNKLCENCLFSHNGKACFSTKRCQECSGHHNTILHEAFTQSTNTSSNSAIPKSGIARTSTEQAQQIKSHVAQQRDLPEILLSTAVIKVLKSDGTYLTMRALIDQGSQTSLITENAAQQLRLPRQRCKGMITGIGAKESACKGVININCTSRSDSYTFNTDVFIMKNLTKNLPTYSFTKPTWTYLEKIQLADPDFNVSRPIDILFGADIYSNIILEGICRLDPTTPIAQQTRLGWILCGNVNTLQCNVIQINVDQLQKFWETEEISESTSLSSDDQECMQFYKLTTNRMLDGRYEVRIPLKTKQEKHLGDSKTKAIAQFGHLERKLIKHENIAKEYKAFIHEYLALGHMKPDTGKTKLECFLPHHCVIRDGSSTTSLRVVFNASSKTSSGQSLNDLMHKGPNLQQDLQSLILKWRQYQFAFTADIEKMFRQILVQEEDQSLQKIIWRDSPRDKLQEYQLTTVTYGTKAAPFLAMMTLKQLANDERNNYQEASKVLEESFYMDDLLHGAHCILEARKLQQDLTELLKRGGFNLRKWASNNPHLLHDEVPCQQQSKSFRQPESTKTLGLRWNPIKDNFTFEQKIDSSVNKATKRSVLSDISKFFDPLGWLTPVTTKLKILFQKIWTSQIQWDEQIPADIYHEWVKIKADIEQINKVHVPRWLGTKPEQRIELHGYCDSSTKAYACVIYCKTYNEPTNITLVAGKSRIIPANKNLSLPRLELCGAHLLAKLMAKVKACLTNYEIDVYGWIDSTAVLGWLQGDPGRWQTFVANRTRYITEIMPPACWRYVKSADNPADCATRGISLSHLNQHPLWWQGPSWLQTFKVTEQIIYITTLETKPQKQVNTVTKQRENNNNIIFNLLKNHSSFSKVVHILAWVYRFLTKKQSKKHALYLTLEEIRKAKLRIIKQIQQEEFAEEIRSFREKGKLNNRSRILNLNPYLDDHGLLRVGGRLRHAHINADMQHPIIIPQRGRLTELIIEHAHKLTFHGGARLTLGFIRQKYWIVGGNEATKKQIRLCVKCKRLAPNKHYQIMGDLPEARSNPSRPFSHTGIDFTGHIFLKANKGRGIKTTKGYVSVFVCMSTKAIHLELVSDLSTSAFMAALRRMAARRGTPCHIYSDNGRNFVGANKQLQQEYQELQQIFNNEFLAEVTEMEINWHFNAPIWPSAGGLWESAVKSFKYHFKRVVGEQKMTYEELSTVLAQIEACLNSRPLCPITEDPDDLDYLTPSHFLTAGSTLTIIETERDLRTRWQLSQRIFSDIWKRWRSEYLTQLTTRSKWRQPRENINLNDVVILHDDNIPPGKWAMGRVIDLHPGADGYVRVVSLKTKNGILKRPITKISNLPVNQEKTETLENVQEELRTNSTKESKLPLKKKKTVNIISLFTSFIFFMTVISGAHCSFQTTRFRQNQSLYFDKLSNLQVIRDEWKLIIYYDMQPYWEGITALNKYTKSLEQTCKTIRNMMNCDIISLQLIQGFGELEYYNQMLLGQHSKVQHDRRRRGLIDGVGYLANSLFGVLDTRFAEQYQKDITLLRDNQRHIASYWKNQTSIIEVEYNLLKRTEQTMNRQHKMISQHIFSIEKTLNELKSETQNISIINELTVGAIIGSNMLHNLKSLQSTLLDTITDIYHGQFNPHLLTPVQLQDQLSTIASQLPKDVSLPVDNVHLDLKKIYKLLKVKARMLEQFLIFEIRLPLISRDSFEVFKIFSIPQVKGTNMISIQPISKYVAINLKKDTYITMTEKTLTSCLISDAYLCRIQRPIYHLKGDQDFCQTEESECETKITTCKNSWMESNTVNNYIYFCCDQCPLRIMCEDQVNTHQLSGAGIVVIDNGCIIKTQSFTLIAHRQQSSELNIKPEVYAPLIPPINHIINITIPHMISLNDTEMDNQRDLTELDQKIKIMKDNAAISESISYHDIHHYTLIYTIIGLVGIVGLVFGWRRVRAWSVPAVPLAAPISAAQAQGAPAPLHHNNDSNQCMIVGDRVLFHSVSELNDNDQCSASNRNKARVNKSTSPICVR